MGATFVPGGQDDYYMPPVFAPAPQRLMPEVPQNMQAEIQRMEQQVPPDGSHQASHAADDFRPYTSDAPASTAGEMPYFSLFPKVKGENIPPSDEEKEEILWQAKYRVLHSNNVLMQISWARDALSWLEIDREAQMRDWKRDGQKGQTPLTPKRGHELQRDAVNIVELLAGQGHPDALLIKGKWLEKGKHGQRESLKDAYLHYKRAADAGCGRAQYRMGMIYEDLNDMEKAVYHYKIGADQLQDSAANYRLGMLHFLGQHGHPRDPREGVRRIKHAAETADEDAPQGAYIYGMLIAGELADLGVSMDLVPDDGVLARRYIEKAAYIGFAKAQFKLGQAFELSQLGLDFHPANSLHYYGLAAKQGIAEAALGVSRWFLFGYDAFFRKNERAAFTYAWDAANAGLATAEFAMGYYHEIGIYVAKNLVEAQRWYEQAADDGNLEAQARLEQLQQARELTKKDHETTTLTRIKTQHGSQRGQRPERFSKQQDVMPTVTEGEAPTAIDFWEPARPSQTRPPLPDVAVNPAELAIRPKPTAPYPEEDRPLSLNLQPKKATPYPVDEMPGNDMPDMPSPGHGHLSPMPPLQRAGIWLPTVTDPQADGPASAFGTRTHSSNGGAYGRPPNGPAEKGMRPVSAAPAGLDLHAAAGYRQSGAGPEPGNPQRTSPGGKPVPAGDPARTRLQRPKPNADYNAPPPHQGPPLGQYHGPQGLPILSAAQPGRGNGPRHGSQLLNDACGYGGMPPANAADKTQAAASGVPHLRISSGPAPAGLPSRPTSAQMEDMAGRSSAPLAQAQRPPLPVNLSAVSSPALSAASTTDFPGHSATPSDRKPVGVGAGKTASAHPDGKTIGGGPATFEEMGIPQGKRDSDCVIM